MAISISTAPTNDATRREAVTVSPEDTLGETAEKLAAADADSALVLDFGRPIGTLTRRDLMRASAARVHPSEGRVREWMSAYASAPAQEFVHPEVVRRTWPEQSADAELRLCELQLPGDVGVAGMSEDPGWDHIPSKGERVERTRCGIRLRGTVWYSDQLQVLVAWDNGESSSLRRGAERFRIVDQPGERGTERSPNGAAARQEAPASPAP